MFSISTANLLTYFYPIGNTPAVSLTQGLPRKVPAKVLLLGCGDVRHVLFSLHIDPRPLDITACDYQPAVIARNIFLLTLIIDDNQSSRDKSNWDLYFHFKIDDASLSRLRSHAQKLCLLSATVQDWKGSQYGRFIKFCDQGSLQRAREMWIFYANWDNEDISRFEDALGKSKKMGSIRGYGANLTALRSASPAILAALGDLPELHDHYWEHGTTDTNLNAISLARHPNPLFAVPSADQILHYGTDPLLGFHLATAYAPLAAGTALFQQSTRQRGLQKVVNAAQTEFAAWTSSFRKHATQAFSVRFFAGDAIAFSLQLRNASAGQGQDPAGWYRDRTHFEPIALGDDYAPGGSAPTLFDVIDTSNLVDHIGALNLLTALAPLLKTDISATLYTERLLKLSATRKDLIDDLIGGHLPTLSTLLGLVSVEMVTNTSATSVGDESLLNMSIDDSGEEGSRIKQQFTRLAWKRPISMRRPPLSRGAFEEVAFDAVGLGRMLYSIYLNMFQGEDLTSMMADLTGNRSAMNLHKRSLPNYHRASFAAFLRFAKSRVNADWNVSVSKLLTLIESNSSYAMSRNYLQELYVWLHLLDVYTVTALVASPGKAVNSSTPRDLRCWEDIPPVVCVTLEVPRKQLAVFIDKDSSLGTPPVHCSVGSPSDYSTQYENHFAALQIGFGTASTRGTRFSRSFRVEVREDGSGWSGQLPLLVSFYAPAWMLLLEPRKTVLAFGLEVTPQTVHAFSNRLGLGLDVFKTTLDSRHVYISEDLPNMPAKPTISKFALDDQLQRESNTDVKPSLSAAIASDIDSITSLASRVDLQGEPRTILRGGCEIHITALSPFNFKVQLEQGPTINIDFPVPVAQSNVKTRIARKSSYIELVATVGTVNPTMGAFTHPLLQTSRGLILWNLPYLNLDLQPALDVAQPGLVEWLTPHSSMMLSGRERRLRENPLAPAPVEERTAVELKDSLFSLFMHYSGLQGVKTNVFGISCPTAGGVHILLLVSSLRLDLSNRTVVLDAAVIPLYDELMPKISPFLSAITACSNLCQVSATKAEMSLWKLMLPAWVERCRSWSHKAGCEYTAVGRIPLSADMGQKFLCSCGDGKFPAGYLRGVSNWDTVSRYAVRVAISPLFHSALVDDPYVGAGSFPKICRRCGKREPPISLMQCSGCRRIHYCSKDCQRADWKNHKPNCKRAT